VLANGFAAVGKVNLRYADVGGILHIYNLQSTKGMSLDLTSAKAGSLFDASTNWPEPGNLLLDNFVYGTLEPTAPTDANERNRWLHLQSENDFRPAPYEQLASVLRKIGRDSAANDILVAKNDEYLAHQRAHPVRWLIWFLLGWCYGYGYHLTNALWWTLIFTVIGWLIFRTGHQRDSIIPTNRPTNNRVEWTTDSEKFHAFIFSFETFVPFLKLGTAENWKVKAHTWRRWYFYFHQFIGFVLCTMWIGLLTVAQNLNRCASRQQCRHNHVKRKARRRPAESCHICTTLHLTSFAANKIP